MFLDFFYMLKSHGMEVSINEWMLLIEALDKGLAKASLKGFYYLCRSTLVKAESEYDNFDRIFSEYFKNIKSPEQLPKEFWDWLDQDERERALNDLGDEELSNTELEEVMDMFRERVREQKSKHDGGNYWIGTGGTSTMGRGGYNPTGIRMGGESRHKSAVQIAGERNFKDFRDDTILDIRQFQVAFRKLRQFSSRVDAQKTELDIDQTVDETCNNAGMLKIVYEKPRKNTVKLLLLIDSNGSMDPHSRLVNRLFQAVSKSNHFKDLQVYYFHNCIYDNLYTSPYCRLSESVETTYVLRRLNSEYKVIFVGDAAMSPSELHKVGGNSILGQWNKELGIDWLSKFNKRYKKKIWLNPLKEEAWPGTYGAETIEDIKGLFPMFELTLIGLETGIKKLLVK